MATANATQNVDVTTGTREADAVIEENLAKAAGVLQTLLLAHGVEKHLSNAIWTAADLVIEAQAAFLGDIARFRKGPEIVTLSAAGVGA